MPSRHRGPEPGNMSKRVSLGGRQAPAQALTRPRTSLESVPPSSSEGGVGKVREDGQVDGNSAGSMARCSSKTTSETAKKAKRVPPAVPLKALRERDTRSVVKTIVFFICLITLIYVIVHVIWLDDVVPAEKIKHADSSVRYLIAALAVVLINAIRKSREGGAS